jgi:hypothetical protein
MTLSLKRPSFVGALYANPRAEISDCKYGPTSGVGKEGCSLGLGKSDEGKGAFLSGSGLFTRERIRDSYSADSLRERSFGVLLHFVSSSRTGLTTCSHSNFLGVSHARFLVH